MKRAMMVAVLLGCGGGGGAKEAQEPKEAEAPAAEKPPALLPVPDEMKAEADTVEYIGDLLFRLDRSTARASDAVLAHVGGKPDPRVQGWIAMPVGETADLVLFLGEVGGEVHTFYAARLETPDATPQIHVFDGGSLANAEVSGLFRSRQIAAKAGGGLLVDAGTELCERYNTVVVPGRLRGREGHLVYLLAATTDPEVHILAGHHRIHVAPDGTATAEPMSRGCVMTRPPPPREGFQALGAMVTHVLTPFPLESHVFASRHHGVDLIVSTSQESAWMIRQGKIFRFPLTP